MPEKGQWKSLCKGLFFFSFIIVVIFVSRSHRWSFTVTRTINSGRCHSVTWAIWPITKWWWWREQATPVTWTTQTLGTKLLQTSLTRCEALCCALAARSPRMRSRIGKHINHLWRIELTYSQCLTWFVCFDTSANRAFSNGDSSWSLKLFEKYCFLNEKTWCQSWICTLNTKLKSAADYWTQACRITTRGSPTSLNSVQYFHSGNFVSCFVVVKYFVWVILV